MAISVVVTPTGVRVRFTGTDRVAAWSRGLELPWGRIVGSRVMTRADAVASSPHLPCPGSWWPGRLRSGSWGIGERRQLWSAQRSVYVVVIYLSGRPFHRIVVDVDDPRGTHHRLEVALLESKRAAARESLRGRYPRRDEDGTRHDGCGSR